MEFAAVRAEARDGRWLRFDVVFVLKLLPVKFSEAGEVQNASHLRISDVKNPRQQRGGRVKTVRTDFGDGPPSAQNHSVGRNRLRSASHERQGQYRQPHQKCESPVQWRQRA